MKKFLFLTMSMLMLGLFSCQKEELSEMTQETEVVLKQERGGVSSMLCPTTLMIQGMTPASAVCTITELFSGPGGITTFTNGTTHLDLETSTSYFVDIQGSSPATFSWCSCGDNIGSTTINAGGSFTLTTSSNGSLYTICSF